MRLVVVPMGVRKAVEALMATAIISGYGDRPKVRAAARTMGATRMVVAELLMTWLKAVVNKKTPAIKAKGCREKGNCI